jgi:predicted glycosyltransferase
MKFDDFDDWTEKYGSETNPNANAQWMSIARFYHSVGVLVDRELVDPQLVYDLMGDHVIDGWEHIGVLTKVARERMGSPDHAAAFEKLYYKLKELRT